MSAIEPDREATRTTTSLEVPVGDSSAGAGGEVQVLDKSNVDASSCPERRPHVILGITGSIAAVKGPRLALRLANELKAHVKVVLTRTVEQYFWKEGRAVSTYDRESWIEFENRTVASSSAATLIAQDEDEKENETDWKLTNGRISIHCEYINVKYIPFISVFSMLTS